MVKLNIQASCADGRPVQELARLIERRGRILGESAKDAVVATAIDVLKSVRTATREKRPGRKVRVRG